MPEELIPIVLFVGLFTFLSIRALANMANNIHRTKASFRFMQGLVERGYSVAEIERMLRACQATHCADGELEDLRSRITQPVPPIKQSAGY